MPFFRNQPSSQTTFLVICIPFPPTPLICMPVLTDPTAIIEVYLDTACQQNKYTKGLI